MSVSVDDAAGTLRDISTDIGNLQWATPRGVQDITGVNKSAMERQLLLADGSITLNLPAFDDGTNLSHSVFKTVPSSSVTRTTTISISGQTLSMEMLYTDYGLTRGQDGTLSATVPGVLADGTVPTWS